MEITRDKSERQRESLCVCVFALISSRSFADGGFMGVSPLQCVFLCSSLLRRASSLSFVAVLSLNPMHGCTVAYTFAMLQCGYVEQPDLMLVGRMLCPVSSKHRPSCWTFDFVDGIGIGMGIGWGRLFLLLVLRQSVCGEAALQGIISLLSLVCSLLFINEKYKDPK